ncbi:MAG: Lysine-tRNA ligase [candidate division TM6 bacterium GW2011_GWF2_37_49]|nr:MAG: Lysine-tRNA ligase [candidate division TM6 bacterium GW2011_GWF2_37_49]
MIKKENDVSNEVGQTVNENEIRLVKINKMNAENKRPWPAYKPVSTTTHGSIEEFEKDPLAPKEVSVAGRMIRLRDHGKTFFGHIQDRSGQLQFYLKKDDLDPESFNNFKNYIDIGDIVWLKGTLFTTKTGEITLKVSQIDLLSKCLHSLPEKFHGLSDIEQRYRQRYLDLISNPESREKFKKRSGIVQSIRTFLQNLDFMEVETPMLHPIPGGAAAKPFVTHHNAYDMDLYLRIAPELYLKRLVIGGFDRVFEINRCFRNEGVSKRHNPEFTTLEFYMAHGDYKAGMDLTEQLISYVINKNLPSYKISFQDQTLDFTPPFAKLTMEESLIKIGGLTKDQTCPANIDTLIKDNNIEISLKAPYGSKILALFEHFVEGKIVQPTFIIGYPIETSPLAKRDEQDPSFAARFELFANGMELANGFTELNDPFDQAERFKMQVEARQHGDQEAHHYDAEYITALEYGLPPAVGVGLGIDRLTMFLTNTSSIKDVILFPTMKKINE